MSISSVQSRSAPRVEYKSPTPVENKPAQQTRPNVQEAQKSDAQRRRLEDKYEPATDKAKSSTQPDLSGQSNPARSYSASPSGDEQGVPELGGTSSSSGGKTSAADYIGSAGAGGKQVYPQNGEETRPGYGAQKQGMWDAAKSVPGVSDQEAALMVAQMQQEGERDVNKSGSSENFGPLNLNKDMLEKAGVSEDTMSRMNATENGKPTADAMKATAEAAHKAIEHLGADGYLHHVRGGDTGFTNPNQPVNGAKDGLIQDDPDAFARTLAGNAQRVLDEKNQKGRLDTNDNRVAANIPGI